MRQLSIEDYDSFTQIGIEIVIKRKSDSSFCLRKLNYLQSEKLYYWDCKKVFNTKLEAIKYAYDHDLRVLDESKNK